MKRNSATTWHSNGNGQVLEYEQGSRTALVYSVRLGPAELRELAMACDEAAALIEAYYAELQPASAAGEE